MEGPFTFQQFLIDPQMRAKYSCSGVYRWDEVGDGREICAYVGKASGSPTLFQRHVQHYMGYIGGTYSIPGEYRRSGKPWALDVRDEAVVSTLLNKEQFVLLIEEAFEYTQKLKIFLACTPPESVSVIERNLLYQLRPTRTTWGTLTAPGQPLEISHRGAFPP